MHKPTKTTPAPLFITELATVRGGSRRGQPTIINREDGRGTTRLLGEEGNPPDGIPE